MRRIGYQGAYSVEFESFNYAKQILNNDMLAAARLAWDCVQQLLPPDKSSDVGDSLNLN